ncbi:MAG TPA: gamma-glutamyltransferase, partial [Sphingomicrobium sp.]
MRLIHKLASVLALVSMAATAAPPQRHATVAIAAAQPFAIAANPLATRAGLNVLKRGGSAVDAAIAMQAMLSLVEPQSSSVAGGAFMTYLDGRTGKITIYDGREVAPAQATSTMFLDSSGKPLPFDTAVLSGRATGVPGVLKMLDLAHREHGKLRWGTLFGEAERTADQGFIVSPRLSRMIHADYAENHAPDVVRYFSKPDGTLLSAGDRLVNKPYARFLRRLATQGTAALYGGSTGAKIVARTRAAPLGGTMTMADLAGYRPVKREAICGPYRVYTVCVPPPPASGVGLLELLALLQHTDIAARGPNDAQA